MAFIVNFPIVHETYVTARVAHSGREVTATLLDARRIGGHGFVDYRLPRSADPTHTTFTARVDDDTYERAQESHELAVRVVPGHPGDNRPDGQVTDATFTVVAALGDVVLIAIAMIWWRRHRRWGLQEVVAVEDGEVTLAGALHTLTAAAPRAWTARLEPGQRVAGRFHLVAEEDLLAGLPLSDLEQQHGSTYVVRGRVVDTRRGWAELELAGGFRLRVETGPHRIRADVRDSTQVHGTLCFTPRGLSAR